MEKILLIDGNSIFYRAFYALPLLKSARGYSNAVYGFANILFKAIALQKPTHVAVAFDVSKKTFRNDLYNEYKANRKPMPDELKCQLPILKEMLSAMKIKVLEKQGLEGDDILGTIAHRFDLPVVIVTGDRDCFQLVDKTTTICRTLKGVSEVAMMDAAAIEAEYGLRPYQIVDWKALAGDASDNIPGVAGIGDKSAVELLKEFDTVENIYKNIENVPSRAKNKLIQGKESAFLSKKLATINCEVDIACTLDDMKLCFPFGESVREFFEKYDMKSFLKREDIWLQESKEEYEKKIVSCEEKVISSLTEVSEAKSKIAQIFAFYVDEQTGNVHFSDGKTNFNVACSADLFGLSFADVANELKSVFESKTTEKVLFDVKSTMHFLDAFGIKLEKPYFDVALARHLLDGMAIKSLNDVLFDLGLDAKRFAFSLCAAKEMLLERMKEEEVEKLYNEIELPLVPVLFDMEKQGFSVDKNQLEALKAKYRTEAESITSQIYSLVGEFNVNSPKQIGEILFDKLNLPHNKKKSTSVDELEYISGMHPVVPLILRYRKVNKFLSTYIDGLERFVDKNNKIHTTFKQTLTGTGRLSSVEPNLQNIPIRGEESKEIRSMFTAEGSGHVLVDADYSQIELRLLAALSGEEALIKAFAEKRDIHTETATNIFHVLPHEVTSDMRRVAKVVNFGVIYGISDFGLANDLGIMPKQAKKYIDDFYARNPKVLEYMKSIVAEAHKTGMVRTILGRIRKIGDIESPNYLLRSRAERVAQNAPLQGSGADIIKIAMLKVSERLKKEGLKAKLIMQVHDELIVDSPLCEEQEVRTILKEEMESAVSLSVPLEVDVGSSFLWSLSH